MLSINGKKFMNISEAVQWLLDNNALPFQSTANYVADTVIAKSTIVNPSPAEIRIGSLVLFADGKVGTVSGITTNGFMVGAESTDLSDGVPHITGIAIDASQHLIFTMSEGDPIDAGLIKEVSGMSIDGSQHLIVTYNDGTTNDLGAIFQGDVSITGKFSQGTANANTLISRWDTDISGLDVDNIYTRFIEINNVIYVVLCVKVTNNTGAAVSLTDGSRIAQAGPLYPPSNSKIYDIEGDAGNVVKTGTILVLSDTARLCAAVGSTSYTSVHSCNFMRLGSVEGGYRIEMRAKSSISLADGASIYLFSRFFLTLF